MEWYYWLIVAICLAFSSFFSCADMVFGVVDHARLEKETEKGNKKAKLALKLAKNYDFSIATILFGNNIVNIFASSFVTLIGLAFSNGQAEGSLYATLIFTAILILVSEFIPKVIGKRFNFTLALLFAYPINAFTKLFFIFVWPISKMFTAFGKLFQKRAKEEDEINEEVLSEMVNTIEDEGDLDKDEAELFRSAIDLNDTQAFEIMTPRVDVFALNIEDDLSEVVKEGTIFKHSRIPVYQDSIDNIIGILPLKVLAREIFKGQDLNKIDILSLCYKPLVIPRNYLVIDLLGDFKQSKVHIALIKDEYGGTEGIVTMEDILEEIVGGIFDETDDIDEEYVDQGKGNYIVDGSMNIDDFFDLIGYHEEFETDYTTVAGFCLEILHRFAKNGDEFDFSHYHFIILNADDFTVEKIKVIDKKYSDEENNNN